MEKNARYSETVKGDSRTYFFDLKQSEKGDPYLLITESRKSKEAESDFERSRIIIWNQDFDKFTKALSNVIQHHQEKPDAVTSKE
ncbi:MAG: DUF3276 family protein [Lewinellaceae bacterium]|nr:DUF3276 family protein [Lewinellaceae bacterium]